MNIYQFLIIGFLIFFNFLLAWFHTNFPQHLWNAIFRPALDAKVYTKEDLTASAALKFGTFGDLWVCPICLGTWLALGISGLITLILENPPLWILAAVGIWPGLGFKFGGFARPETRAPVPPPAPVAPPAPSKQGETVVAELFKSQAANLARGEIDPLWVRLTMALASPPADNPEVMRLAAAYKVELAQLPANCPHCEKGALIRKYLGKLYDAGIQ